MRNPLPSGEIKLLGLGPRKIPTPFGSIEAPALTLPPVGKLPKLGESGRRALKHSLGSDLSQVVAMVPWVGDIVSDALEDMHLVEIRKALTPEEFNRFLNYTKIGPDTIAILRTFL